MKTITTTSITENDKGELIVPAALKPAKPTPETEQEKIIDEIIHDIRKVEQEEQGSQVSTEAPDAMLTFVRTEKPELLATATLVKRWEKRVFQTYSEHILLFEREGSYWYVYVFQWFKSNTFTLEGVDAVEQPTRNEEGKEISPRSAVLFEDEKTTEEILNAVVP